jgi:hypothetical protein
MVRPVAVKRIHDPVLWSASDLALAQFLPKAMVERTLDVSCK